MNELDGSATRKGNLAQNRYVQLQIPDFDGVYLHTMPPQCISLTHTNIFIDVRISFSVERLEIVVSALSVLRYVTLYLCSECIT